MPVRSGYMPVKKALRPEVQLCIGDVVHEHRALVADAVDVGRLPDHQAAVVDARLHPADVVAHDEQDVGLLLAGRHPGQQWHGRQNGHNGTHSEHCYDCSRLHTLSPLPDLTVKGL